MTPRALYSILEHEVVPAFYDRDAAGIPHAGWQRMRRSMATLTSRPTARRMARDYVEQGYLALPPSFAADGSRTVTSGREADANAGSFDLHRALAGLHIGEPDLFARTMSWAFLGAGLSCRYSAGRCGGSALCR